VYACTNTFLPTAVAAVVLFYGGNLVLEGHMSAGALVSFMLYQQSLASAIVQTVLPSCGCVKGHKYLFIPGHMRWLRHAQSQPSRKTLCMLLT